MFRKFVLYVFSVNMNIRTELTPMNGEVCKSSIVSIIGHLKSACIGVHKF